MCERIVLDKDVRGRVLGQSAVCERVACVCVCDNVGVTELCVIELYVKVLYVKVLCVKEWCKKMVCV